MYVHSGYKTKEVSLRDWWKSRGPQQTTMMLLEGMDRGVYRPEDFSLAELAKAFCGDQWYQRLDPRFASQFQGSMPLLEAGNAVDVSAFSNITGQIIYTKIHQGWDQIERISDKLFTNVPTRFDGERVPGIGRIPGEGEAIHPMQSYPEIGYGEHYFDTPATTKRGLIVSVSREAIYFDRTDLVTKRAGEVGERLGYNKEKRCLACFAGITINVGNEAFNGNNHSWNGNSYNNYSATDQTNGNDIIYANALAGISLTDWEQLEQLELLAADQLDPDTGLPVNSTLDTMVVMPFNKYTARRIVSATEIRTTTTGAVHGGGSVETLGPDPRFPYNILDSRLLYQLLLQTGLTPAQAREYFWLTDSNKAFEYRENWPLTVVAEPANSVADFERDIVLRQKASERGTPWAADPRYSYRANNT